VLLVLIVLPCIICSAAERQLCYAFLLRADVYVTCGGETTRITRRADLKSYGVSDEKAVLAYSTEKTIKQTPEEAWKESTASVIDLATGAVKHVTGRRGLGSACGGIFTVHDAGTAPPMLDVVHGGELRYPPYGRFRCSADRKTVVGVLEDLGADLYEGVPPATKIADGKAASRVSFDVSPDGSKVAYFNRDVLGAHLCVRDRSGTAECADRSGDTDSPSVDDVGRVLVTIDTEETCYYKGSTYFVPGRLAGKSNDLCVGIGYWRPGLKTIELIEPLGRNPQWISPATAKLLRDWAARQGVRTPQ
jgi:hypothetical protein